MLECSHQSSAELPVTSQKHAMTSGNKPMGKSCTLCYVLLLHSELQLLVCIPHGTNVAAVTVLFPLAARFSSSSGNS